MLKVFNHHVHLHFFYIVKIDKEPIVNLTDKHTVYSKTVPLEIPEMELAAKVFELGWIDRNGNPKLIYSDAEFLNESWKQGNQEFGIEFQTRPVRRQNKVEVFEWKNGVIRHLALQM